MTERDNSLAWIGLMVLIGALGLLIVLAREGDLVAIVVLAVLAVLVFLVLGGGFALVVMDKMNVMEERRFRANVKENLLLAEMSQRSMARQLQAQTRVNKDLASQNAQLARGQEPAWGLDLDSLFGDADLVDLEQDGGRWSAR